MLHLMRRSLPCTCTRKGISLFSRDRGGGYGTVRGSLDRVSVWNSQSRRISNFPDTVQRPVPVPCTVLVLCGSWFRFCTDCPLIYLTRTGERPESVVDLGLAQFGGVLDPFSAESTAATEPDCVHGRGLDDCSMTMEVVKTEANGVVQGPKPLRFLERRGCRLMVCRTNARFGRLRNHALSGCHLSDGTPALMVRIFTASQGALIGSVYVPLYFDEFWAEPA